MQEPAGGSMGRRALLVVFVVLLLIGAYGAYVVSYPEYPKVKGCVNPFAVTTPVSRVQENWSKVHVFFKLATSRDFWKLAKPWDVDYSHVKIVKHTIEYKGEKITMLAMGIPLKDGKHVIALYEFSKPVQGVKIKSYLLEIDNNSKSLKTIALTTNGKYIPTDNCQYECNSDSDCGDFASCEPYCCKTDYWGIVRCCIQSCGYTCIRHPKECIPCVIINCPWCLWDSCEEWGSKCVDWGNAP